MAIRLERKTVQELEQILYSGSSSHKECSLRVLQNWATDPELEMEAETRQLLRKLITDFLGSSE
jgi:hypothetical protein